MKYNRLLLLWLLSFATCFLQAQTYEIRAVNKGNGYIGVEMRITAGTPPTTSDFLTDLVFGLKWEASYNVDLDDVITSDYGITKSGGRVTKGVYHFQAFFADNTAINFPSDWALNTWEEIMSVKNTLTGAGAGTFEVVEPSFDLTTDPNFGFSLADFTPVLTDLANSVPLPIGLENFTLTPQTNMIMVDWEMDSYPNTKGFEVQRAEDNVSFKDIAWVPGNGNSSGKYEWPDKDVEPGVTYYYRIKQVDLDEKVTYSDTKRASLKGSDNAVRIIPNPVNQVLRVILGANIPTATVSIKIIDTKGVVVMKRIYPLNANKKIELNVAGLARGQYFLTVANDRGLLVTKPFMKD